MRPSTKRSAEQSTYRHVAKYVTGCAAARLRLIRFFSPAVVTISSAEISPKCFRDAKNHAGDPTTTSTMSSLWLAVHRSIIPASVNIRRSDLLNLSSGTSFRERGQRFIRRLFCPKSNLQSSKLPTDKKTPDSLRRRTGNDVTRRVFLAEFRGSKAAERGWGRGGRSWSRARQTRC